MQHEDLTVRTRWIGWLARNSYAVPTEVGKEGTESPMFIEPVQMRKDGIAAMFLRQAEAAQQSAVQDAPLSPRAAASGKRKREPSPPAEKMEEDEGMMSTLASSAGPSSPSKRSVAREHLTKIDGDPVISEGNSDTETLSSGPSLSQTQFVRPPHPGFIAREMTQNLLPAWNVIRGSNIHFKAAKPRTKKEEGDTTTIITTTTTTVTTITTSPSGSHQQNVKVGHTHSQERRDGVAQ